MARQGQVRARRTRAWVAAIALGALTGGVAACTSPPPPPAPDGVVAALAKGLTSGTLDSVPLDGATGADATASTKGLLGDLATAARSVTVTSVAKDATNEKKATATLTWSWPLAGASTASGSATSSATTSATTSATPSGTSTASANATGANATGPWTYTVQVPLVRHDEENGSMAWHAVWSPALLAPDLTSGEKLQVRTTQGKRADIVGAGNTPLMTSRPVFQLGLDKGKVDAATASASAAKLAALLGVDAASYAKKVASAGAKQFVVGLVVRTSDPLAQKVAQVQAVPGGAAVPGNEVLGPTPTFAKSLLGTVGDATAEMVQKSGGTLKAGDVAGLSGLEARYDARLRGTTGLTVTAAGTDASGQTVSRELFSRDASDGTPLQVTLDVGAQVAAEEVLASQTSTPTSLVVVRPSTGEIVAAANGPAAQGSLATTGRSAPGSTFKIVTALALLRKGYTPDTVVPCTPTVTVDGRSFKNYDDYPADKVGDIPLRVAFANSCNTAFISQQAKVSQADLANAAASLGIGVDVDLGFPAFLGSVPSTGTGTTHAASMIGQAQVEVAPMDMATVVASVVTGTTVRPQLVRDNPAVASFPKPAVPLTSAEATSLRTLMGAVVSEGSGRVLAPVGVTLAKTGTAEYGTGSPLPTHAWMVAARGDLAVAAYVETGQSGSGTAGPLIAAFLQRYGG